MGFYKEQLQRDGFVIIPDVLNTALVYELIEQLSNPGNAATVSQRAGRTFAIRNLLNAVPLVQTLAGSDSIRSLVALGLGSQFQIVRAIYLDKHKDANWKVAWHQDLTITVRDRRDVEGYGPWSMKGGVQHVQPPVFVLENMLAVRIHLDDTDESNGGLRVVPGSHCKGRLSCEDIQALKQSSDCVACIVRKGGVMLMRPLLLHASSAGSLPGHRRVLHLEYSSAELDGGLEWHANR